MRPLTIAIFKRKCDDLAVAIANGDDPNLGFSDSENEFGRAEDGENSPLIWALKGTDQFFEGAKLLLDGGANPNSTDKNGETALSLICSSGFEFSMARLMKPIDAQRTDLIRMLGAQGANPNLVDMTGRTPIFYALKNAGIEGGRDTAFTWLKALIDIGANPNCFASNGYSTPLSEMSRFQPDVLSRLSTFGFDLMAPTPDGNLINTIAKLGGHSVEAYGSEAFGSLELLLTLGLDPNKSDADGRFPIDYYGVVYKAPKYVQLLKKFGALETDFYVDGLERQNEEKQSYARCQKVISRYNQTAKSGKPDVELLSEALSLARGSLGSESVFGSEYVVILRLIEDADTCVELVIEGYEKLRGSSAATNLLDLFFWSIMAADKFFREGDYTGAFHIYDEIGKRCEDAVAEDYQRGIFAEHAEGTVAITQVFDGSVPTINYADCALHIPILQFDSVIRVLAAAIDGPEHYAPDLLDVYLGRVLIRAGDPVRAELVLKKVSEADPGERLRARYYLSIAYADQGLLDEALESILDHLAVQPNNYVGWSQLGDVYRSRQELLDAHEAYRRALELEPAFSYARKAMNNLERLYKL